MKTIIKFVFIVLISISIFLVWAEAPKYYIDAHSQPPYPEQRDKVDLDQVIKYMVQNNVSRTILSARVELEYSWDIADFAKAHPDQITAAVSLKLKGMNTTQGFINTLNEQVESGRFDALAEMLLYHAEKFDKRGKSVAPEFMVMPDDPKTEAYLKAGRTLGCPVFLHIEFASLEKNYGKDYKKQYMDGLKKILQDNPDLKIVLMHVAELTPDECKDLFSVFRNVYLATGFLDLTIYMTGEPVPDYSEKAWEELFEDYPDRFIFAFDRVFEKQWEYYTNNMEYAKEKLSHLTDSTAKAIAYENAERLWKFK